MGQGFQSFALHLSLLKQFSPFGYIYKVLFEAMVPVSAKGRICRAEGKNKIISVKHIGNDLNKSSAPEKGTEVCCIYSHN